MDVLIYNCIRGIQIGNIDSLSCKIKTFVVHAIEFTFGNGWIWTIASTRQLTSMVENIGKEKYKHLTDIMFKFP